MSASLGKYVKGICAKAWVDAEKAGMKYYEVSDDVVNQMKEKLAPITQAWLKQQDAAGYPATEVYNQFLKAYKKHSK